MRLERIDEKEIDFEVKQGDYKAFIGDKLYHSSVHTALYHEGGAQILGIKPRLSPQGRVFALEYSTIIDALKFLGREVGIRENIVCYSNPINHSFATILNGSQSEPELKEPVFFDKVHQPIKDVYRPVLIAVNGFDAGDSLGIYLTVTTRVKDGEDGYLVIAKDRFNNVIETISNEKDRFKRKEIFDKAILKTKTDFQEKLALFRSYQIKLAEIKATGEELVAVSLDINDFNRDIQTISSDPEKASDLRKSMNQARIFLGNQDSFEPLLGYIIRQFPMNFGDTAIYRNLVENLLHERKAYTKLVNRLLSNKNKVESERRKYIGKQVDVYREISDI